MGERGRTERQFEPVREGTEIGCNLQPFRGTGIGTRLLQRTLDASRTSRLQLIKARLQEPSLGGLAGQLQRSLVGSPRCVGEA